MKKIIYLFIGITILISLIYAFSGGENLEAYEARIEGVRKDRVRFLQNSDDSPFKNNASGTDSLSFYPLDRNYEIMAKVTVLEEKNYITLPTNDRSQQKFLKYGYASFKVKDATCKLMLLRPIGEKKILMPFADETSGVETYGGGRYIDLNINPSKRITLDFNLAYNPYCAYNGNFSCPLPPKENILQVKIEAGEKKY